MAETPFKLLGLTQKHKDFLQRYAQTHLGSSSRTKAILALIENAMKQELSLDSDEKDSLKEQAVKNKQAYIFQHQEQIKNHNQEIQLAKSQGNHELAESLSRKKHGIKRQRIQFSLPIYDYEYLNKLAMNSHSSIQYYITAIILGHLYSEKILLGNEIEVLKQSNYELFKIGVNINQIAKANNAGDKVELPVNKFYSFVQNHVKLVEKILKSSVGVY